MLLLFIFGKSQDKVSKSWLFLTLNNHKIIILTSHNFDRHIMSSKKKDEVSNVMIDNIIKKCLFYTIFCNGECTSLVGSYEVNKKCLPHFQKALCSLFNIPFDQMWSLLVVCRLEVFKTQSLASSKWVQWPIVTWQHCHVGDNSCKYRKLQHIKTNTKRLNTLFWSWHPNRSQT